MPSFTEFCEHLVDRLEVDESYLTTDVPAAVRRCQKRLLRDYNFPKSIRKTSFVDLAEGAQSYNLPEDMKGPPKLVLFMDTADATAPMFSLPLTRKQSFQHVHSDGVPRHYWLEGTQLWTDVTLDAADAADTNLVLVYQSHDPEYNETWMLDELEDILFTYCMFRLASEYSKTEIAAVWAALWKEDQTSLAIYTHDLEFGDLELHMREARALPASRYPASSVG